MRVWSTEVMKIGAAGARRSVQTETIEIPTFRMTDAGAIKKPPKRVLNRRYE
jgi:hypothetical protein